MELTTCLWFDGRAREAANFYTSIFPDSSVADNWIAPTDTPGNAQGEEIVVNFKIFGQSFIGLNGGPQSHMAVITLMGRGQSYEQAFKSVYGISWAEAAPILARVAAAEYAATP